MINRRGGNWLIYLSNVGLFITVFCITFILRFNVWGLLVLLAGSNKAYYPTSDNKFTLYGTLHYLI